jgi:metal-sulfur cluster biosynthetic enzyme
VPRVEEARAEVLDALGAVMDPCSVATGVALSLPEMGLVDDVSVDGSTVAVRLLPTFPGCIYIGVFEREIVERVGGLPWVDDVKVSLARAEELWDESRISEDGRRRLHESRLKRRAQRERERGATAVPAAAA